MKNIEVLQMNTKTNFEWEIVSKTILLRAYLFMS